MRCIVVAATLFVASVWSSAVLPGIVVPTASQLRYQSTDFVALIHFNMGTFAHNGDPCCDEGNWDVKAAYAAGKTRDPATFNPRKLNTTQWFESITALGANIAILTAKHGCGFTLWPTKSKFPDGTPYGYNVGAAGAAIQHDVVQQFVDSARAAGVGYGFYYSIMKNFKLCRSFSGTNSCLSKVLPGQWNLTDEEYTHLVREQVTELWTQYGNFTEIWVDSGLDGFGNLMSKLQPQALFNKNWCGTESGHPSHDVGGGDIWSTSFGLPKDYFGSPSGTHWIPMSCDPQLFQEHAWFWEPDLKVRTLDMMIPIYHDIVGRGMVMELAFSIDRDGLVQDTHADVYRQLGDWVRRCYGSPIVMTFGIGDSFLLKLPAEPKGLVIDRFQLQEDIVLGQRVRSYVIESTDDGSTWTTLVSGGSIGMKRIQLLKMPIQIFPAMVFRLRILHSSAMPAIKFFGAFSPCDSAATDTLMYV